MMKMDETKVKIDVSRTFLVAEDINFPGLEQVVHSPGFPSVLDQRESRESISSDEEDIYL